MGENDPNGDSLGRKLGLLAVIVTDLVGYVGAGLALGYLLNAKLGAPEWILPLTGLLGLALAFYRLYRLAKREMTK